VPDRVIVAYRPKPGQDAALEELTRSHVRILRELELATNSAALAMRGRDGTIVETFEWRDGGTAAAHEHPEVQAMWERYAAVCDYVPLSELAEAASLFATFKPIDLGEG
jgi:hypothetical protein